MDRRAPIDVVVHIEHPMRELDVACLAKHYLEQRHNLRLEAVSVKTNPYRLYSLSRPLVTAFPWFHNDEDISIKRTMKYWPFALVVNLSYEQIYLKITETVKRPIGPYSLGKAKHIAWSHLFREFLEASGVAPENITVVGNPNYGFYQEPYRRFFPSKNDLGKAHGLDPDRPWVLVPENYGAAFYQERNLEKFVRLGVASDQAAGYREFARRSLASLTQWLSEAARDCEAEVILRPRPYTSMSTFMDFVGPHLGSKSERLHILQEGTVREWILASDRVASSYSTTLIEAAVAGKEAAIFEPEEFPDYLRSEWDHLLPHLRTSQQLSEFVRGEAPAGSQKPLEEWALAHFLPAGDPFVNIAEWLAAAHREQLASTGGRTPRSLARTFNAFGHWGARSLKALIRGSADRIPPQDQFDDKSVAERTARWARILNASPEG